MLSVLLCCVVFYSVLFCHQVYDGHYSLLLKFSAPALKLADFTERQVRDACSSGWHSPFPL